MLQLKAINQRASGLCCRRTFRPSFPPRRVQQVLKLQYSAALAHSSSSCLIKYSSLRPRAVWVSRKNQTDEFVKYNVTSLILCSKSSNRQKLRSLNLSLFVTHQPYLSKTASIHWFTQARALGSTGSVAIHLTLPILNLKACPRASQRYI